MASGKTEKKRKATAASSATTSVPPSKKSKKSEDKSAKVPTESITSPGQGKSAKASQNNGVIASKSLKVNGDAARKIKPRKRAADFLSDDESDTGGAEFPEVKKSPATEKPKSSKKSKKEAEAEAPHAAVGDGGVKSRNEKKDKLKQEGDSRKKAEPTAEPAHETSETEPQDESDDEGEDDQTVALIKGFESSGDEDISGDEGYEAGKPIPNIPDSKKAKRQIQKKTKKRDTPDHPGAVYVGRIPHGFYEKEMRAYFSQFGEITRLRLSRNRVTGRSKHYAFIEFASESVAKVVAKTMDNYLMFGHILKCKFVPEDQLHPEIWKGANRRFNKTPWNRVEQFRLEGGKSREKWSKSVAAEEKKRASKAEKLKALGYEVKLPTLKGVKEVPVREKTSKLEEGVDGTEGVTGADKADETKAIDVTESADTKDDGSGKSKKKAKKNKEAYKMDENATRAKESEENDLPTPERKKREAESDVGDSSKKAKKAKTKDTDVTASEKSSKKTRRESAGDETKPAKVKKGDKKRTKA